MPLKDLYWKFEDLSWRVLDSVRLGDFFDEHDIPPILFPITVIILFALIFILFMSPSPATPETGFCGDGRCGANETEVSCPADCIGNTTGPLEDATKVYVRISGGLSCEDFIIELRDESGKLLTPVKKLHGQRMTYFAPVPVGDLHVRVYSTDSQGDAISTMAVNTKDTDVIPVELPWDYCGTSDSQENTTKASLPVRIMGPGGNAIIAEASIYTSSGAKIETKQVSGLSSFKGLSVGSDYYLRVSAAGYYAYDGSDDLVTIREGENEKSILMRPITSADEDTLQDIEPTCDIGEYNPHTGKCETEDVFDKDTEPFCKAGVFDPETGECNTTASGDIDLGDGDCIDGNCTIPEPECKTGTLNPETGECDSTPEVTSEIDADIIVPDDKITIQGAIDAASDGDVIMVRDGIYTGIGNKELDFKGKAITVISENGPQKTIIDCEKDGRGLMFVSGEGRDSVFSGFTIMNGVPSQSRYYFHYTGGKVRLPQGASILVVNGSSPTIDNCILTGGFALGGGGIYVYASSPLIRNCIISNNTVQNIGLNGDSSLGSAIRASFSQVTVINTTIISNIGGQGTVFGTMSNLTIKDSMISDNRVTCNSEGCPNGGAIYIYGGSLEVSDSIMEDNKREFNYPLLRGGAIYVYQQSLSDYFSLINTTIRNHQAHVGGAMYSGSIYNLSIVQNCLFENNSGDQGGALALYAKPAVINRSVFIGNTAEYAGGAIGGTYVNTINIYDSIFKENSAYSGGAISTETYGSYSIYNSLFTGNIANRGAVVYSPKGVNIAGCTIADNKLGEHGRGGALDWTGIQLSNSIVWNNEGQISTDVYNASYSIVEGGSGTGVISANPQFVGGGDYSLKSTSPAIGAGNAQHGTAGDILGNMRSNPPTIGAYEYVTNGKEQWTAGCVNCFDPKDKNPPLNDNQKGVCKGSKKTITVGGWKNYYVNVKGYEPRETTIDDGIDNDCDGKTDEDLQYAWIDLNSSYRGGGPVRRAEIFINGERVTDRGEWQGFVPDGEYDVDYKDVNDGVWQTLSVPMWNSDLYIYRDIACTKNTPVKEWYEKCWKDFVTLNASKEGEGGTHWLTRMTIFPDAVAPKSDSFSLQSSQRKSVTGTYNEHDSYYTMDYMGQKTVGMLPLTSGDYASGLTSYPGERFTFRIGEYSPYPLSSDGWYFVRVKTSKSDSLDPTYYDPVSWKIVIRGSMTVLTFFSDMSRVFLNDPHQAAWGNTIENGEVSAIFWRATPVGAECYKSIDELILEDIKETCSSQKTTSDPFHTCYENHLAYGNNVTQDISAPTESDCCSLLGDACNGWYSWDWQCLASTEFVQSGHSEVCEDWCYNEPEPHCAGNEATLIQLGSMSGTGTNNIVEFYGLHNGEPYYTKAYCEGDWAVNPCDWTSSCTTGWETRDSGPTTLDKIKCGENEVQTDYVFLGSNSATGTNSIVEFYGIKDGEAYHYKGLCPGYWKVTPCKWELYCTKDWQEQVNEKTGVENVKCAQGSELGRDIDMPLDEVTVKGSDQGQYGRVTFCGYLADGTTEQVTATCRGDWWVNACEWTSSCKGDETGALWEDVVTSPDCWPDPGCTTWHTHYYKHSYAGYKYEDHNRKLHFCFSDDGVGKVVDTICHGDLMIYPCAEKYMCNGVEWTSDMPVDEFENMWDEFEYDVDADNNTKDCVPTYCTEEEIKDKCPEDTYSKTYYECSKDHTRLEHVKNWTSWNLSDSGECESTKLKLIDESVLCENGCLDMPWPHCLAESAPLKNIGSSESSSQTKNTVEFVGVEGGVPYHGKAVCLGFWSMNPCEWSSSCDSEMGWEYNWDDYHPTSKDNLDCPEGVMGEVQAYEGSHEEPKKVDLGTNYGSGTNSIVSICGLNSKGKYAKTTATCLGDWWVDPCDWDSSCSTGWEETKGAYAEVESCDKVCPTTFIDIGSSHVSGHNNRVSFCGVNGNGENLMTPSATCLGDWWVDPCNWNSSCNGDTSGSEWTDVADTVPCDAECD